MINQFTYWKVKNEPNNGEPYFVYMKIGVWQTQPFAGVEISEAVYLNNVNS